MKKLMIAAAIVCAAVLSQAATANWKVGAANVKDGGGTSAASYSGTAYVFDAAKVLGSVTDKTAQQIIFEAFASDVAHFDATAQTGYAGSVTVASGTINQNNATSQFSYGDRSSEGVDVTHDFFFVLVDDDKMYLSKSVAAKAYADDKYQAVTFGNQNPTTPPNSSSLPSEGFKVAGQWAQAVPEPTSGLLLLLGVAGMALRRRRA